MKGLVNREAEFENVQDKEYEKEWFYPQQVGRSMSVFFIAYIHNTRSSCGAQPRIILFDPKPGF